METSGNPSACPPNHDAKKCPGEVSTIVLAWTEGAGQASAPPACMMYPTSFTIAEVWWTVLLPVAHSRPLCCSPSVCSFHIQRRSEKQSWLAVLALECAIKKSSCLKSTYGILPCRICFTLANFWMLEIPATLISPNSSTLCFCAFVALAATPLVASSPACRIACNMYGHTSWLSRSGLYPGCTVDTTSTGSGTNEVHLFASMGLSLCTVRIGVLEAGRSGDLSNICRLRLVAAGSPNVLKTPPEMATFLSVNTPAPSGLVSGDPGMYTGQ
mmetsp:Transcript_28606/g.54699  ORF Transcript_28606/g.54699 Transcript_28606/m.54699 type:complete len:271 (+) Transcript_28606:1340-2152(+)